MSYFKGETKCDLNSENKEDGIRLLGNIKKRCCFRCVF